MIFVTNWQGFERERCGLCRWYISKEDVIPQKKFELSYFVNWTGFHATG